jgi:hypothetical protein
MFDSNKLAFLIKFIKSVFKVLDPRRLTQTQLSTTICFFWSSLFIWIKSEYIVQFDLLYTVYDNKTLGTKLEAKNITGY